MQAENREKFFKWLKDMARYGNVDRYVEILDDSNPETETRIRIYTDGHCYGIKAKYPKSDDDRGYLGCIASTRKPRAGEDWSRGNDLADGPFTEETWISILNDIIGYELIKIEKPVEPIADVENEIDLPQVQKEN